MKTKKSLKALLTLSLACLISITVITFSSAFNPISLRKEIRQEITVYICVSKNAVAYHSNQNCRGLNKCTHEIKNVNISKAKDMGYRACKICYR